MQTVLVFILVLSLLVFVHELGHFLFAKRAGILVREFAIGFGPKIFSKMHGETLYSIRALPLGGYVRMAGEDAEALEIKTGVRVAVTKSAAGKVDHIYLYEPAGLERGLLFGRLVEADLERELFIVLEGASGEEIRLNLERDAKIHYDPKTQVQVAPFDRQFGSKTAGQKAMTIVAGPLFNILLTILLFALYTGMTGIEDRLPVERTLPGMPAEAAGIRAGDVITAVNGEAVHTMDALRYKLVESKGNPVVLTVERGNQTLQITVTPKKEGEVYQIGALFNQEKMKRNATAWEAIVDGFRKTWEWATIIFDGFSKLLTHQISISSLGGPVQMGDITGKAAQAGLAPLIKWMAILSLNLGIFNLLPIPALDGSRLMFIGLEAVRGKPVNPNKESMVHLVGFALLMMLMLVVTFNDIRKIFFT
jgi:regulator of sigma E protease